MIGKRSIKGNPYGNQYYRTLAERNAHPLAYRKESVQLFFVEEDGKTYHLKGGITNQHWKEYFIGGGSTSLSKELEVNGVNVGGISDGTTFPLGTDIEEILRKMLVKRIPPTYYPPTYSISVSGYPFNLEAGSVMDLSGLQSSFAQKDAGLLSGIIYTKNGVEFFPDATPFTLGDEALRYQSTASYEEGPLKYDNLDEPNPDGRIPAGSINSNIIVFNGLRKLFFGVNSPDQSSGSIRALQSILNPVNGKKFSIQIPAGTHKVTFSYPSSLRNVSTVKYIEGMYAEVKGVFAMTLTQAEGANNYQAKEYKTYEFIPDSPFESPATYEVTI
jgi:hypothetical protein